MDNEQFNHWLAKFKQFLIDNNAEVYWQHTNEDRLRRVSHPAYWLNCSFNWGKTPEGYNYWDRLCNLWDGIANLPVQIHLNNKP